MKETVRAIVIIIATALGGRPVKVGEVFLVPEEIGEDSARELMRMSRPRAAKADESATKKRLAEYNKEQAAREKKEKAKREAAEEAAGAEADERAKAQQEADEIIDAANAKTGKILDAANAEAVNILDAANAEAVNILNAAKAGGENK